MKEIQIGKKEVKLSLFADRIPYFKTPKALPENSYT
jgi:hypothetical protein